MFSRRGWFLGLLMAAVAFGSVSVMEAASGKNTKAGKVEGTLVGVATNGIVIRRQNGTLLSLGVTAATKVELNGRRVSVTSLPIGAQAQALFDPATLIASKVEAVK